MKALKKTNEVIDFDARRGHNKGGEVDGGSVGSWFRVVASSYTYPAPTILPHTIEFGCNCVTLFLSLAHIYILWYKSHSARLKPGWANFGLRPSCTGRAGRPLLVSLPPTHPKCKYNACNQSTILCSCDIYQCKTRRSYLSSWYFRDSSAMGIVTNTQHWPENHHKMVLVTEEMVSRRVNM